MQSKYEHFAMRNGIKHLFDCHLSFKQMYEINLPAEWKRDKPVAPTMVRQ